MVPILGFLRQSELLEVVLQGGRKSLAERGIATAHEKNNAFAYTQSVPSQSLVTVQKHGL